MSSSAIGCDPSYVALPLLAGMAGAIGNTTRIILKRGWTEPAVIWTGIVGPSGTQKSPALEAPLGPIKKRQKDAFDAYRDALAGYDAEKEMYLADLAAWKRNKNRTEEDRPKAPEKPVCERFWCSDTTVEALADRLQTAPRGLLVICDELSGWLNSFNKYNKAGKAGNAAHWLTMHGARDLLVDRKTGDMTTIYVPRAAVSITGGIQESILQTALGTEHFADGLAARLLLAMPPVRRKVWTDAEIPDEAAEQLATLFARLMDIQPGHDREGREAPKILPLTSDGKDLWVAFYNSHAAEMAELTGDMASAWSKLEGYAARLALVIHCIRVVMSDPELETPGAVDAASIDAGITLTRWFAHETRRVYAVLSETDEQRQDRKVLELLVRNNGRLTPRDLGRASRAHREADVAEQALNRLAAAELAHWETTQTDGRPKRELVLNEGVGDKRYENAEESGLLSPSPPVEGGTAQGADEGQQRWIA